MQGVILDPSCSGSGTVVTRMDHLLPQAAAGQVAEEDMNQQGGDAAGAGSSMSAERQRVEQLAKFQVGHGGDSWEVCGVYVWVGWPAEVVLLLTHGCCIWGNSM